MDDSVLEGPLSPDVAAVLLYLTYLRAATLVGLTLAERFPTYASWEVLLDDPDARRDVETFAGVLSEIRAVSALGAVYDLGDMEAAGDPRAQALEALTGFAARLGVEPDDLLSLLLHA
jgi:hypothetical protein